MAERKESLLATIGKRMLGIRKGSGCCGAPSGEAAEETPPAPAAESPGTSSCCGAAAAPASRTGSDG